MKIDSVKNYPEGETWQIGDKEMPVVENTSHMGILRSSSNQERQAVESNIKKAKRAVYSLMDTGLHGEKWTRSRNCNLTSTNICFPRLILWPGIEWVWEIWPFKFR